MQTQNPNDTMTKLECDAALSDRVLQAARAAIPSDPTSWISLPASGERNQPLLPLLVGLLDATQAVANAVADNAWDESFPLDSQLAKELAQQCRAITADIENATQCPNAAGWQS